VQRHWLTVLRPIMRYSNSRNAFVLRLVGRRFGPVLRVERRHMSLYRPVERRRRVVA
jgi:hypothetical protein